MQGDCSGRAEASICATICDRPLPCATCAIGGLIWKHFKDASVRKLLIVVGDFSQQSSGFYNAVAERFSESNIRLYRLDDMRPLFDNIMENSRAHGKGAWL